MIFFTNLRNLNVKYSNFYIKIRFVVQIRDNSHQMRLPEYFVVGNSQLTCYLLCPGYPDKLKKQLADGYTLSHRICENFGFQTSTLKTPSAFHGSDPIRAKIIVDRTFLKQISNFEYLGYNESYITNNDVVNKLHKFNHMCGTIRRTKINE